MATVQKPDLKAIEPYEVSYAELRPDGNRAEVVQNVAMAINVRFTEFSENLPFVPPKQFSSLTRENRVFLIGPSGSGKSRAIIELLRSRTSGYGRIFVINPSNPAGASPERQSISRLAQQFGRGDIVIWDNFPDGLVKRDLESAFGALELINASPVGALFIALKPTYLEMYRGLTAGLPDIYTQEIALDPETMKAMLKAYGGVEQFSTIFKSVSPNVDKIARILWQKQPLSLTVVDYYKALVERSAAEPIDEQAALQMAQAWLPAYDYFERQFEVMKTLPARKHDVEFLYSLRFCYDVGFERTYASVGRLQRAIFGSEPPAEPTLELGTWLYLSGQNYSMHDSAKNAVRLAPHAKMKIAGYLSEHFSEMVPKSAGELYSLGLFIGSNIEFLSSGASAIPEPIYRFMKTSAVFERAIGRGAGENFERLDDALQEQVLLLVDTELEFGVGLAESIGERFRELDESNRRRLMDKTYHGMLFARYFGQSVGRLYSRLDSDQQSLVMSNAEKNPQFADGLGMGLGYVYAASNAALQRDIMARAESNFDIARGVGFGFGLTLGLLTEQAAKQVIAIADQNSELDAGFGMGMAVSYSQLPENLKQVVLERASRDSEFAFGLGIYSAYYHKESCPPEIFGLAGTNTEIASGIGLGLGPVLFYLPEKFRHELEELLKHGSKLDEGVGSGLGFVLKHFPPPAQEMLFAKAATKNPFASGLGYGIGYTWRYVPEPLRRRAITLAGSSNYFARGLGIGLGCHLDYLEPAELELAIALADSNPEADFGLGAGGSWAWPYFGAPSARIVEQRLSSRPQFAKGFGFGLARVIRQYPAGKKGVFEQMSRDPHFLEGFYMGSANYLWTTSSAAERDEIIQKASASAEGAAGLGAGLGLVHPFISREIRSGLLQLPLARDPDVRKGLGEGIGSAYKYLPEAARVDAFKAAEDDVEFAVGLGKGLGSVYIYLDEAERNLVWSNVGENGFSRGLGAGIGSILLYLGADSQDYVLSLAGRSGQLALGLGAGIAADISYLPEALVLKALELARSNPLLAAGLGEGCARVFSKLGAGLEARLPRPAEIEGFSFGFGVGIGEQRGYLTPQQFEQAERFAGSPGFTEGFAIGLGSSAAHTDPALLRSVLESKGAGDTFARGFGFGMGHAIDRLEPDDRDRLFELMKGAKFLEGLGEGVGHYLPVTGARVFEDLRQKLGPEFAAGAAAGIAASFWQLSMEQVTGILEYAASDSGFGAALGSSLAGKFASLSGAVQAQVAGALQADNQFAREFAKAVPAIAGYLNAESRVLLEKALRSKQEEASGVGK